MVFRGIHMRAISQDELMNLICNMCSEITLLKWLPHPPGANETISTTITRSHSTGRSCYIIVQYNNMALHRAQHRECRNLARFELSKDTPMLAFTWIKPSTGLSSWLPILTERDASNSCKHNSTFTTLFYQVHLTYGWKWNKSSQISKYGDYAVLFLHLSSMLKVRMTPDSNKTRHSQLTGPVLE